jgi:hypothetical protein
MNGYGAYSNGDQHSSHPNRGSNGANRGSASASGSREAVALALPGDPPTLRVVQEPPDFWSVNEPLEWSPIVCLLQGGVSTSSSVLVYVINERGVVHSPALMSFPIIDGQATSLNGLSIPPDINRQWSELRLFFRLVETGSIVEPLTNMRSLHPNYRGIPCVSRAMTRTL